MPEFILNTADMVDMHPLSREPGKLNWIGVSLRFTDLDGFTQGYIEALFFTDNAPNAPDAITFEAQCESGKNEGSFPADCGFADLAPDTLARILAECAAFQASPEYQAMQDCPNQDALPDDAPSYDTDAHAGRDFWYTRNGHGCGFWDGDWPAPHDDALTAAAKRFGEVWTYFGDDGKVHLS